jgi:hypothetical protein
MNKMAITFVILGLISLIIGIISRITFTPVYIVTGGLGASAFLAFTNTCFLLAILAILKDKK